MRTVASRGTTPRSVPTRSAWPLVCAVVLLGVACTPPPAAPAGYLDALRERAGGSERAELTGTWLLAELVAPGGDRERAAIARRRLGEQSQGRGQRAWLALGIDAEAHGRFGEAARAYVAVIEAGLSAPLAETPLFAWYAAHRLTSLSSGVPGLWERARPVVERAMQSPGAIGWRARGELVDWWGREGLASGALAGREALETLADRHGCVRHVQLSGPFGRGTTGDSRIHFPAELPAPWPARFEPDPEQGLGRRPQVLEVERHGCLLRPRAGGQRGVYYVQSFLELPAARDVIIAVQGAYAVFVDDHEVLTRDAARWGIWPRFGVRVRLAAGRHCLLARLGSPETAIRLLRPDGLPLGVDGADDAAPPYALTPPIAVLDPNALAPYLDALGVPPLPGVLAPQGDGEPARSGLDLGDLTLRYVAAYLAHAEGQSDVANVLMAPLVDRAPVATAMALGQRAMFIDQDPIYPRGQARDLGRDLREAAVERDANLWGPRLWLALDEAERESPGAVVAKIEAIAEAFPEVPSVIKSLANIYARLGWPAEHARTVAEAARRFPDDTEVLDALLRVHERRGELAEADAVAARIQKIDPKADVQYRRALERQDFSAAIGELKRIGALHPDRQDIAFRVADLLVRAGQSDESLDKLRLAFERSGGDGAARLALADARYAAGEAGALVDALVDAIRTGSEVDPLRGAIELVEGATDLEPYRRDGLKIIAEHQAGGEDMTGSAARVLDYATLWVAEDGSARMLEHEIIKVQSRDGIAAHAEQQLPRGMVLRMRTIKRDGRIFEPEIVAAKPTVTMPHLEVGDYIETESIWVIPGDGQGGRAFMSPRWYFREENVAYHLSEFVVVSPKSRPLSVETTGDVPEPSVHDDGALVVRRWRVDRSPAVPSEPLRAPVSEFLPSVRLGWGIDLAGRLRALETAHEDDTPLDPRVRDLMTELLGPKPPRSVDERARRLYRGVLERVQPGREQSPAPTLMGRSGDPTRAFLHLCQHAGIDARLAVVQDRLTPPSIGPMSDATSFNTLAVRVQGDGASRWLVVRDRFTPYGFLPSSLRGQPAVMIQRAEPVTAPHAPPLERVTTPLEGADDEIHVGGTITLDKNGSATLALTMTFSGSNSIRLRSLFGDTPKSRYEEIVRSRLLGAELAGGRISDLEVDNLRDQLDEPVVVRLGLEVVNLGRRTDTGVVVEVPFLPRLAALGRLGDRETPLYLPDQLAMRQGVDLVLVLPEGAKLLSEVPAAKLSHGEHEVDVADRHAGARVTIRRAVTLLAGRVSPQDYPAFRTFVQQGGDALNMPVRISLD